MGTRPRDSYRLGRDVPGRFLTVRAAADLLGVHPVTIRRHIRDGTIPAVKVGREYRLPLAAFGNGEGTEIGHGGGIGSEVPSPLPAAFSPTDSPRFAARVGSAFNGHAPDTVKQAVCSLNRVRVVSGNTGEGFAGIDERTRFAGI